MAFQDRERGAGRVVPDPHHPIAAAAGQQGPAVQGEGAHGTEPAAQPLIWNLPRVGRRVRLVRADGGYAGKPGTSAQDGLTSSQRLAEPGHRPPLK